MAESNTPTKWKVVSSKAFYWGRHIMKPGQIFKAVLADIPEEVKQNIISVDEPVTVIPGAPYTPYEQESVQIPKETIHYRIKERNDGEYYDVVDSKGKRVSERKLTKEEAQYMLKSLMT